MNAENNEFHDTEDHALNEELVAYLDGELNRDGVSRVEDELSNNAEYRLRLMQLQQAWPIMYLCYSITFFHFYYLFTYIRIHIH